ncbi:hypothetical protein [Priestia megaterium]|uniref:hypothetical protein n=1 Tax=Priestia megaterium TaxID=1404 RepID=UPI00300A6486
MLKTLIEKTMRAVNTRNLETLERDIQIVQTYFGLGSQAYPTYQSIAEEFGGTRQRAEQIVSRRFMNKIKNEEFTIVQIISQLLEEKDAVFVDDFIQQLNHKQIVTETMHIRGLFRLLQKFRCCLDYKLYNLDLIYATEADYINRDKLLFIKDGKQEEMAERMRSIKTLPGIHGMVNFLDVISMNSWLKGNDIPLYQSLIIHNKKAKVFFEAGECNSWFLFEERANVMINALGKVVNITDQVKTDILAETIHSDISKRSLPKRIPPVEIIKEYLVHSNFITIEGEYAKIHVEKRNLTEIEIDIYNYFKKEKKNTVTFPELNFFLEKKGHKKAYRKQKLYHCPFVYVDKSLGLGNYQLKLISQFSLPKENEDLYKIYKNKLKQLQGTTDVTREEKTRREQSLLQEWLFKNKETEECAICGRTFSCHSLVAAHKKKRANCTEEERTDPYIVMPACVFGCDYLYEYGYIQIRAGNIQTQNTETLQVTEREYVKVLENKAVDPRWLRGQWYFTPTE